jgi:hypothetical protein
MWRAISSEGHIVPTLMEGTITNQRYLQQLQNEVIPVILVAGHVDTFFPAEQCMPTYSRCTCAQTLHESELHSHIICFSTLENYEYTVHPPCFSDYYVVNPLLFQRAHKSVTPLPILDSFYTVSYLVCHTALDIFHFTSPNYLSCELPVFFF